MFFFRSITFTLLSGGLFYLFFYRESAGINVLFWGASLLTMTFLTFPKLWQKPTARLAALAFAAALLLLFVVDSELALSAVIAGLVVLAGSTAAPTATSLAELAWAGIRRLFAASPRWLFQSAHLALQTLSRFPVLRFLHPTYWIPVGVAGVFLILLSGASPLFADRVEFAVDSVFHFLSRWLDIPHLVVLVLLSGIGAWLAGSLLAPVLEPRTPSRTAAPPTQSAQTLADISRLGLITLALVNALLLVYNIGDIEWIWFNFYLPKGVPLYQLVHEGTYFLIASILLSIGCLIFLFQPKYANAPRRQLLLIGALAWITQNAILVASVAIRNARYIDVHGLAYKRIGVLFFLVLTLCGLITLALYIHRKKSFSFLWRINSLAAALLWLGGAAVDWDGLILRHNLGKLRPGHFDAQYHFSLGDHQLPLLLTHEAHIEPNSFNPYYDQTLERRAVRFIEIYEKESWLSWDPRSELTYRRLKAIREADPSRFDNLVVID